MSKNRSSLLEDFFILGGLVVVQFIYAGSSILLGYLMSLGFNPLTLVAFTSLATFFILTPLAVFFERSLWPKGISIKLVVQLLLLAFSGVTLFQTFFLKGIDLTSPAMATAMPNLAPGLIFVIAWSVRLEKVNIGCLYSKVKIMGTLLCMAGAIMMGLMHSASAVDGNVTFSSLSSSALGTTFDRDKIIGCLYLIAAVICLSSNAVLQASTLRNFPAPMSLSAVTSLIGVFTTMAVELLDKHKIDFMGSAVTFGSLIGFSALGGVLNGVSTSFNGWAMKKRGPVLVSMFSPIGTACSVVISMITLGESFQLGSLAGMFLLFAGLYFVLWAKGKENNNGEDKSEGEFNREKPLLS
ncbi:hypothetical protein MLD38_018397 [Melastoma candidum]|uniref:Uncharacterized protein n=1 Tax=Melastoma candidum TaxID=119954 RepID=A0ACB9QX75_9MYRT|nr:hypothetical protein MLD38_018397 [Melastoma candidum]